MLYPLGYGPSLQYLCTGVVLIFGPNWFSSIIGFSRKKLTILRIDKWGENPFLDPLVVQANLPEGAFGADGPALGLQFPGGGGVGVKDPGPPTPCALRSNIFFQKNPNPIFSAPRHAAARFNR